MPCKIFNAVSIGIVCATATATAEPMKLGTALPNITCDDKEGNPLHLGQMKENDWVLVYFYPKADTPGCTKQACSLRDAYAKLEEQGVKVIGVSKDTVKDQKDFSDKFNLPFTLLADNEARVIKAFGVPQMPVVGMAKRQAFLFKKGILHWRDLEASTQQQAADVMEQIKK